MSPIIILKLIAFKLIAAFAYLTIPLLISNNVLRAISKHKISNKLNYYTKLLYEHFELQTSILLM